MPITHPRKAHQLPPKKKNSELRVIVIMGTRKLLVGHDQCLCVSNGAPGVYMGAGPTWKCLSLILVGKSKCLPE